MTRKQCSNPTDAGPVLSMTVAVTFLSVCVLTVSTLSASPAPAHPAPPRELVSQAKKYLRAAEPRAALKYLRKATRMAPDAPGYFFLLGRAALTAGKPNEAKYGYGTALSLKPDSVQSARGLARAHLHAGEPLLAVEVLKPFTKKAESDKKAIQISIDAYVQAGLAHGAFEMRQRLAPLLPDRRRAAMRRKIADYYFSSARWKRGLRNLQKAVAAQPDDPAGYLELAKGYQRVAEAGYILKSHRLLQAVYEGENSQKRPAVTLTPQGSRRVALRVLQQALQRDPDNEPVLETAVEIARNAGDLAEAERYLRRLLARKPHEFKLRMELVDLMADRGMKVGALREASEALRASDPPTAAHAKLAGLAEDIGNYHLALTHWKQVWTTTDPPHEAAAVRIGTLLTRMHELSQAAGHYEQAIDRLPDCAGLRLQLARTYQRMDRHPDAVRILRQLIENDHDEKTYIAARTALAGSLVRSGKYERARHHLKKAINAGELNEQGCRAIVLLGERTGTIQWAAKQLQALFPDAASQAPVLQLLKDLYRRNEQCMEGGRRLLRTFENNDAHTEIAVAAAELFAEGGALGKARRILNELQQRQGVRYDALSSLAIMYLKHGKTDRAPDTLGKLVEPLEYTDWVLSCIQTLQMRPEMVKGADGCLAAMVTAEPSSPAFWKAAADMAAKLQRVPAALAEMQNALRQNPADAGIATAVAALALHNDQPHIAMTAIQTVPESKRHNQVLLKILARARMELGMPRRALHSLHRAVACGDDATAADHRLFAQLYAVTDQPHQRFWHLICALTLAPEDTDAQQAVQQMFRRRPVGVYTITQGLHYLRSRRPTADIVDTLISQLENSGKKQTVVEACLKGQPGKAGGKNAPDRKLQPEPPDPNDTTSKAGLIRLTR